MHHWSNHVNFYCLVCGWFDFEYNNWYQSLGRVSDICRSAQNWFQIAPRCCSLGDEAPALNRVENGVWTHPHAPPPLRWVRSSLGHAHEVTTRVKRWAHAPREVVHALPSGRWSTCRILQELASRVSTHPHTRARASHSPLLTTHAPYPCGCPIRLHISRHVNTEILPFW